MNFNTINDILSIFNGNFYKLRVFKTKKSNYIDVGNGVITIYYTKHFHNNDQFINCIINSNISQIETDCTEMTNLLLLNSDYELKFKSNCHSKSKNIFYRFFQTLFPKYQYNYTLYYLNRKIITANIKLF